MDKALQTMINNMPEKTGKSLEEWKSILKQKDFTKHSEGVKFLKTEYKNETVGVDLVQTQYKGKEKLLPVYEALIKYIQTLGFDVTITPKKRSVSIIRKRQFVLIKPATKTRIDLGFKLKDKPTTERLENSGPFGTM